MRSRSRCLRPSPKEAPTRNVAAKSNAPPAVQEVAIITSPAGATVTMDDRADAVCRTPCRLDAAPGRHRITFVLPGYGVERREFEVGTEALELPSVILRAQTGTLVLNSVPTGAAILVNGKKIDQLTPAMLPLAAGQLQNYGREGRTAEHDIGRYPHRRHQASIGHFWGSERRAHSRMWGSSCGAR